MIHPCLMSSFSMASLSWSDGGWLMLRWCAVRCTIRKPTTAYGEMTVIVLIGDITYEGFRFSLSNRNTLYYTKMSTLGWVSGVLEKVEKFTNSYLQYLSQVIKSYQ